MLAEQEDEDDETIITTETDPDETIQIQGSDRKYPAIVRRAAYTVDKSRRTIQTISRTDRRGKLNPLYSAYAEEIQAYRKRRKSAARSDRQGSIDAIGAGWPGLSSVGKEKERGEDLSEFGHLDPRIETTVVPLLAKDRKDE